MEGTIAQILFFAGNFAPRNWAFCNGQIIAIAQNTALFAILGTTYGGNGQTTFALPNFQGRVPMGVGQGPGLFDISLGQVLGTESVTLTQSYMPAHSHTVAPVISVANANAENESPAGNIFTSTSNNSYTTAANTTATAAGTSLSLAPSGNNIPFSIIQPYLAVSYLICLFGVFPARN